MSHPFIDTNVLIRYFTENPKTTKTYRGVFPFFSKLETSELVANLTDLVVFETYYVLTKVYRIKPAAVAERLNAVISFQGIVMQDKPLIAATFNFLKTKKTDIVDAHLIVSSLFSKVATIYSYDKGFNKHNLKLLPIE